MGQEDWVLASEMKKGRGPPGVGRSSLACHTEGYRLPGWARVWRRPKDAGPCGFCHFPNLTSGGPLSLGSLWPPAPDIIRLWKWAAPAGSSAISGWQVIIIKQEDMGPLSLVTLEAPKVLVPVEFPSCRIWQAIYQAHCGIFYHHSIYTKRAQPGGVEAI